MKVLVIAPHPDDEIIGIGGTIAKRVKENNEVYVCIVNKGSSKLFSEELINETRKECREANKKLGVKKIFFLDFPAVMLETIPRYEFNGKINEVIQEIKPDEIYIPHRGDMQIDHQMVADATMVAVRPRGDEYPRRVYAYETLSETGWNIPNSVNEFIPTVYEDITEYLQMKLDAMRIYKSQLKIFPEARSIEAIEALAKYRGAVVNLMAAEAFELIREVKKR